MDHKRVQTIKNNLQDKLSSELIAIRDSPGEEWSDEAVIAARELIDERTASGALEATDSDIINARAASERAIAEGIAKEGRRVRRQIDSIATLYFLAGALGLVVFGFFGFSELSEGVRVGTIVIVAVGLGLSGFVIVAAFGLVYRTEWARVAALSAAIPLLFEFPVGTIIALYSLHFLMNKDVYPASINDS